MDIFDACDTLKDCGGCGAGQDGDWEYRLKSIVFSGLPAGIADIYRLRLVSLYARLRTANPVRDVLCNIAIQQATYQIKPWVGGQQGTFLQCGGLGSSAFPASLICNWRVANVFNLGLPSPNSEPAQDEVDKLASEVETIKELGLCREVFIVDHPVKEMLARLMQVELFEGTMVHLADIASTAAANELLTIFNYVISNGNISLFSGSKPVIEGLLDTLKQRFGNRFFRLVDTLTLTDGQPDRPEALLIMRHIAPEFQQGQIYTALLEPLRGNRQIVENSRLAALDCNDAGETTGYLSFAGVDFTTSSTNLGIRGSSQLHGRYWNPILDAPWPIDTNPPCRFRTSFGKIANLPNGMLIERIPVTAEGLVPLGGVMPSYLQATKVHGSWLETGNLPDLPVIHLPGTWLALADSGAPLSHWLIERFLPLLALKEIGVDFDLLLHAKPPEYQRVHLELAGFTSERIHLVDPSKILRCGRLLAPLRDDWQLAQDSFVQLHHPASRDGIEAVMKVHDPAPRRRVNRLYVSRMDARAYRACLNEEEVIEFFRSKGFSIVNGKDLSPTDALTLYGSARIIFGPLGAGILNSVFSPPGCQIGTFGAPPYREEAVEQIANLIGHDHSHLICEYIRSPDRIEGGTRNSNFVADLDALAEMLDIAESRSVQC